MAARARFGTEFVESMSIAECAGGSWEGPKLSPVGPLSLHPASHALHYGSACFEGLKAHRGLDGIVRIFRLDRHVQRMQASARSLVLPVPPAELLVEMITDVVRAALAAVPAPPGSLYIRPTLLGTDANVGAAASPSRNALLFVLASPVGDYFAGGERPLGIAVETTRFRTAPQFGTVKAGANYAMALGLTLDAVERVGADQVLFAPGGAVQETGASNFFLLDAHRVVTPALTPSFLAGVTRDSLLQLATALGYRVEEADLRVDDVLEWAGRPGAEAALSGTAAGLAGVGRIWHDRWVAVGDGAVGPHTVRLRQALGEVHTAARPAPGDWLTPVVA
jgi:branched-chain amino acid aminotransferase